MKDNATALPNRITQFIILPTMMRQYLFPVFSPIPDITSLKIFFQSNSYKYLIFNFTSLYSCFILKYLLLFKISFVNFLFIAFLLYRSFTLLCSKIYKLF